MTQQTTPRRLRLMRLTNGKWLFLPLPNLGGFRIQPITLDKLDLSIVMNPGISMKPAHGYWPTLMW